MSERVRHTVLMSLTGSKRIIVAACAAIAMFLGAVSAGASVFVYDKPSSQSTDMSAVFNPTTAEDSKVRSRTKDTSADNLSTQSTFQDEHITLGGPIYSTPSVAQVKNPAKKNLVADVLRTATNSGIFQAQADLLDQLQGKTNETLNSVTAPIDIPGVNLPVPSIPIITDGAAGSEQTAPPTTDTPPAEPPANPTTNSLNASPITDPEN